MSKEQSAVIKGVAILLMLLYHIGNLEGIQGLEGFIGRTISNASHPVHYFLIVSGYGLYCAYSRGRINFQYLMKRIARLYLIYWLVLLIFVLGIGSFFYPGRFNTTPSILFLNMMGWHWDYCQYTWFLLPYILMMLSARGMFAIIDKLGPVVCLICGTIIYLATGWLISRYYDSWLQYHLFVYHIVLWASTLFSLILGALFAKLHLDGKSLTCSRLQGKNLIITILLLASYFIRGQIDTHALNLFYAILVIWLILHLDLSGITKHVLVEFGHKSMFIWFVQGFVAIVMFSEYFLLLKWPVLIWIVWTIVCYLIAVVLSPIEVGLSRLLWLK